MGPDRLAAARREWCCHMSQASEGGNGSGVAVVLVVAELPSPDICHLTSNSSDTAGLLSCFSVRCQEQVCSDLQGSPPPPPFTGHLLPTCNATVRPSVESLQDWPLHYRRSPLYSSSKVAQSSPQAPATGQVYVWGGGLHRPVPSQPIGRYTTECYIVRANW